MIDISAAGTNENVNLGGTVKPAIISNGHVSVVSKVADWVIALIVLMVCAAVGVAVGIFIYVYRLALHNTLSW